MPPKKATPTASATAASDRPRRSTVATEAEPTTTTASQRSKKRGRPAKATTDTGAPAKKRGRQSKAATAAPKDEEAKELREDALATAPKKRVRPAKTAPETGAVASEAKAAPRKRGRPPKGGETTKSHVDEEAAEQQLEEELLDTAAATTGETETGEHVASASSTRGYWLMKAEQEDREETTHDGTVVNTKFTINDLHAKKEAGEGPELWDGVRNVVAAKHMRAMRRGDLAFFYASGGKRRRTPGITGVMEVVSEAEVDGTAWNEGAYGFVEEEEKRGRWCVVGVEFRRKLDRPVSLKELQGHKDAGGPLERMQMFRQTRLSVSKVEPEEWRFIMDVLVGGDD